MREGESVRERRARSCVKEMTAPRLGEKRGKKYNVEECKGRIISKAKRETQYEKDI